jgi:hypothetical protein
MMHRNITRTVEYDIVTGTGFSISFARHGVYVSGYVETRDLQPESRIKGCPNRRLEAWSPYLAGTVWWQEEQFNVKTGEGSLQFCCTPEGTPILILDGLGKPVIEWHKGHMTYYKRNQ